MPSRLQGAEPTADTPSRPSVVLGALLIGGAYLGWRATTLGSGWSLVVTVPLFVVEVLALVELTVLALATGGLRRTSSPAAPPTSLDLRQDVDVDVAITADRAEVVDLERSLLSTTRIHGRGRGRIIVIDDEDRPPLRAASTASGADYAVDPSLAVSPAAAVHRHTGSDLYLWLSTREIADPAILTATASSLVRSRTAVCQVASWVLNADALAHLERERDDDALLNRVTGPALSRWGAAPWIGPGSIVRRSAIDAVGGVGDRPSTPRLAARLHRAGWTTHFEPRTLIGTVAPDQLATSLAARRRQAAETWDLLGSPDGPVGRGLHHRARLAQVTLALRVTVGLRLMLLAAALVAVLVAGAVPLVASPLAFALAWGAAATSAAVVRLILARGHRRLGDGVRQGWRTVDADVAGLLDVVSGRHRRRRRLTDPARRPGERRDPASSPTGWRVLSRFRLAYGAVLAIDAALLLRTATLFDDDVVPAFTTGWRIVALSLAVIALLPIVDVLQVVVRRSQRRRHHRRAAVLTADLDGTPATTVDVTPRGVGLLLPVAPVIGATGTLSVHLPTAEGPTARIIGDAEVRSVSPDGPGRWRVGLQLTRLSEPAHRALVAYWALGQPGEDDGAAPAQPATVGAGAVQERRTLRSLTATAVVGGLATLLLGPAAGVAFAAGPASVAEVCVATVDARPVADVAVERLDAAGATPLGVTGGDGCLPVAPAETTTGFALGHHGMAREADALEYGTDRLAVVLTRQEIRVVDGDGAPAPIADVRAWSDGWRPTTAVGPSTTSPDPTADRYVDGLLPVEHIEVTVDGRRHVRPLDGDRATIVLPRLRLAAGATNRLELDDGTGWVEVEDGRTVAPGPLSIRIDGERILRLDLPEGHEVMLPAGDLIALSVPTDDAIDADRNAETTTTSIPADRDAPADTTASITIPGDPAADPSTSSVPSSAAATTGLEPTSTSIGPAPTEPTAPDTTVEGDGGVGQPEPTSTTVIPEDDG
ncbi:MAG: PilZ domain-containing protein [Actinomycetota bacterium]